MYYEGRWTAPFVQGKSQVLFVYVENIFLRTFLLLQQTELNPVRHLVVDVSCIDKNLDMRLMLAAKRKITYLSVS